MGTEPRTRPTGIPPQAPPTGAAPAPANEGDEQGKPLLTKKPSTPSKHSRMSNGRASLLMRTLGNDALERPTLGCAGRMAILAFLTWGGTLRRSDGALSGAVAL